MDEMSELDFEEETIVQTSASNLEQEDMKERNILSCEMDKEFPNETPLSSEDGELNTESGELSNGELTDLEEGEINDSNVENSTICRFFSLGTCRYGEQCRFVHVGVSAYHMFENKSLRKQIAVKPSYPLVLYQTTNVNPRPLYSNVNTGDAWEQGLQEAKRLVLSAKNKKVTDAEFEEKKLYLNSGEEKTEHKNGDLHSTVKRILHSALSHSAFSEAKKKPVIQKHHKRDAQQGRKSPIMKHKLSSQKWVDPWRRSRSRTRHKSRSYSSLSSQSSLQHSRSSSCSSSCDHSNESDKSSPRDRARPPQSKLSRVFSRTFPRSRNRSLSYSGSSNQSLSPSCSPKRSASRSCSRKRSAFRSYSRLRSLYRSYSRSPSSSRSLLSRKSGKIHLPCVSFTNPTPPVATLLSSRGRLKRRRISQSMSPKRKKVRTPSISECESSDSAKTASSHSSHRRSVEGRSFQKADDFNAASGHYSSPITHPMHHSDSKHSKGQRKEKLENSKSDFRDRVEKDSTVSKAKSSHRGAPVATSSKLENKTFDCRDQLSISAKQVFSFAQPKKDSITKSKSPFDKCSGKAKQEKVSPGHHASSRKQTKPMTSSRKSEATLKSSDKGKMEPSALKASVLGSNSAKKRGKDSELGTSSANKSKKELIVPVQEKNSTTCSAIVKKPSKQMCFAE